MKPIILVVLGLLSYQQSQAQILLQAGVRNRTPLLTGLFQRWTTSGQADDSKEETVEFSWMSDQGKQKVKLQKKSIYRYNNGEIKYGFLAEDAVIKTGNAKVTLTRGTRLGRHGWYRSNPHTDILQFQSYQQNPMYLDENDKISEPLSIDATLGGVHYQQQTSSVAFLSIDGSIRWVEGLAKREFTILGQKISLTPLSFHPNGNLAVAQFHEAIKVRGEKVFFNNVSFTYYGQIQSFSIKEDHVFTKRDGSTFKAESFYAGSGQRLVIDDEGYLEEAGKEF